MKVAKTSWFKAERVDGKPSRGQRVLFAIQGGLSETFVKDELKVDLPPLRTRLLTAFAELSKHVHGNENTITRGQSEQDIVAERTVAAMGAFLDALRECRDAVLMPIAEALDSAAVDALLSDSMLEVRHAKPATTARYIHAVNSKQIEAQGKYLAAIKLGKNGKEAA